MKQPDHQLERCAPIGPQCLFVGGLSCWLAVTGFVEGLLILSTLSVGALRAFPT